jgi:hypothetical protein
VESKLDGRSLASSNSEEEIIASSREGKTFAISFRMQSSYRVRGGNGLKALCAFFSGAFCSEIRSSSRPRDEALRNSRITLCPWSANSIWSYFFGLDSGGTSPFRR